VEREVKEVITVKAITLSKAYRLVECSRVREQSLSPICHGFKINNFSTIDFKNKTTSYSHLVVGWFRRI
jgi:hypothetical protein